MTDDTPTDWRGTPITPHATVIYGAGVGRSIEMVEAIVEPQPGGPSRPHLTASGDVWLRVIHRSYQAPSTTRTRVGADRLTVVTALPATDLPLASQVIIDTANRSIARHIELMAEAEAETDRPARDEFGRPTWTVTEEITYHKKEIRKEQRKIDQTVAQRQADKLGVYR